MSTWIRWLWGGLNATLNDKYDGETALLWVEAHPDASLPEDLAHHHAHVLANLLGVGDKEFVNEVPRLFQPEQVLLVGLNNMVEALHSEPMSKMKIDALTPEDIKEDSTKIIKWLDERKPSKVLIHFDLDVLDMGEFRSTVVSNPQYFDEYKERFPRGSSMETIIRVLQDVGKSFDVVGLAITEHFPWDALSLQNMLSRLPLIADLHKDELALPFLFLQNFLNGEF